MRRLLILLSVAALLGLSACGDDETDGGAAPTATTTATVTGEPVPMVTFETRLAASSRQLWSLRYTKLIVALTVAL